jgi:N-acetylmuramoyl-L-alanine amidase
VLHYTGMASAEAALARLREPGAEVSAHYLIAEDGRTWRLVPEAARAWHAGAGSWRGEGDVNSRSIGIELANPGPLAGCPPFAAAQMTVLEALLAEMLDRWRLGPEAVIAHSDMAPGRKADPGPKLDWRRLARAGLAIWPREVGNAEPCPERFRRAVGAIGYGAGEGVTELDVLEAFRLRFRPGAAGALAGADVAVAEAVAR